LRSEKIGANHLQVIAQAAFWQMLLSCNDRFRLFGNGSQFEEEVILAVVGDCIVAAPLARRSGEPGVEARRDTSSASQTRVMATAVNALRSHGSIAG
jgi:hypothetical protein